MRSTLQRRKFVATVVVIAIALIIGEAMVAAVGQVIQRVDDRQISIKSTDDIAKKRKALIDFIWGPGGMPTDTLPAVEKNDKSPVDKLENLDRVDTLTISMEASQKGYAHHFIPKRSNKRLVIVHHGHAATFNDSPALNDSGHGLHRTINELLNNGYSVLAVYMPHIVQFTTRVKVNDAGSISHDSMFANIRPKSGSPMKFFLEPVAVSLHYLKNKSAAHGFPAYEEFHMAGLSGGGWTTTVYAAIDPTIKYSFPVAGSIPLYLRFNGSVGDTEQTLNSFYSIAGYPDLYVLGSHGKGRKQVQILVRNDDCCFGARQHDPQQAGGLTYDQVMRRYESRVRQTLFNIDAKNPLGFFRLEIDEAAPSHMISWNAVVNTILAELNGGRQYIGAASNSDAFVRGVNGHLWHYGANGWRDTEFPMVGVPSVVKGAVNPLDVFYRSPRGQPMHAYSTDAGWKQQSLTGTIITDPAAVSSGRGTIEVVAFGGNYKLYQWRVSRNGPSPFRAVEGSVPGFGTPVIVSRAAKHLDIIYRRFDRGLHHLQCAGDSWEAKSLGGTIFDFPSAVAPPDGSLHVYVRSENNRLVEAMQSKRGEQWKWTSVSDATDGQRIAGSPNASFDGGVIRVHARSLGGELVAFESGKKWEFTNLGRAITGSPKSVIGGAWLRDIKGELWLHDGNDWISRSGTFD